MAVLLTFGIFSVLPNGTYGGPGLYDAHHGCRRCLARASRKEMSDQVTDKLEENCAIYLA